ncbi:MAG: hypothetical protein LBD99_01830, partial [Candidatus Margulisbacteria bacterium]|nr:hypothetical protein [Candidatus Margulisiibacteriota bacterium]
MEPRIDGNITTNEYQILIDHPYTSSAVDYNAYIQALYDEINVLEKLPPGQDRQTKMANSLAVVNRIVSNAADHSRYDAPHFLSLCYALTALTIIAGQYEEAKRLLFDLNARPGRVNSLLGPNYNDLCIKVEGKDFYPFVFMNHSDEKQMWFISMIIQLVEKDAFAVNKNVPAAEDPAGRILSIFSAAENALSGTARKFYRTARQYIELKIRARTADVAAAEYYDLYKYLAVDNPAFGFGRHLLMTRILNDLVSNYPNDVQNYEADIKKQNTAFANLNNSELVISNLNGSINTPKRFSSYEDQMDYDNYVQCYLLYANYLKSTKQTDALTALLNSGLTERLSNKEGVYFAEFVALARREINFLKREAVIVEIKNHIPLAAGEALGSPDVVPQTSLERQRMYYIQSEEALLREDPDLFLALTLGGGRRGIADGVLNSAGGLTEIYRAGRVVGGTYTPSKADRELLLNARCGAIERYLENEQKTPAQEIYTVLKSAVLGAVNWDDYLKQDNVNTRFLFIAAQLEIDAGTRIAIYKKLYNVTPAAAVVSAQGYAYDDQNARGHWAAAGGLSALYAEEEREAERAVVFEAIQNEYKSRSETPTLDAAYIKNIYCDALLLKILSDLEQNPSSVPPAAETDLAELEALINDGAISRKPWQQDRLRYNLIDLHIRAALLAEDKKKILEALDAVAAKFNLSNADAETEKLLYDRIVLHKIELTGDAGLYSGLRTLGAGRTASALRAKYAGYRTADDHYAALNRQYYAALLLQLAKLTAGPNRTPGAYGDDDPAEQALEEIINADAALFDKKFFAALEPRLRLDYAWSLAASDKPDPAALEQAGAFAVRYHPQTSLRLEAEDLLRLVWFKSNKAADNQRAVAGGSVDSGFVPGYRSFAAERPDFAAQRVYAAFDSLIVLYGYNKNTRDDAALLRLAEIIEQNQTGAPARLLRINVLLAAAEMHYRQSPAQNTLGAMENALQTASLLLDRAADDPEKYCTYAELQIRRILRQYKNAPAQIKTELQKLKEKLRLNPEQLTEKLLADTIEINLRALDNATQLTESALTGGMGYLKFYQEKCATDLQKTLFINELLALAKLTAGENVTASGDEDEAEKALRAMLLLPETIAALDPDYYASLPDRMLLDFCWSLFDREDVPLAKTLAIAEQNAGNLLARPGLAADLRFEAQALQMLAYIKRGDRDQLPAAEIDLDKVSQAVVWYDGQLSRGAECPADIRTAARELLPVAYAYVLRDYAAARKFIRDNISAEIETATAREKLDPVNFAIIADCWAKENITLPENLAAAYAAYVPQNDAERLAQAGIIFNFVEQQLKKAAPERNRLLDYLQNIKEEPLPPNSPDRIYIEHKRKMLLAKIAMLGGDYTGETDLAAIINPKKAVFAQIDAISKSGLVVPAKWFYLLNDARRLLAQIKEEQGWYTEALGLLEQVDLAFIAETDEQEARIYDDLQKAGVHLRLGEREQARGILQAIEPQTLNAEQKGLYYSRRIALADKTELAELLKLADLTPANICEANLALLDPEASAALNLAQAETLVGALPPEQQADYAGMLTQLKAYADAETRNYAALAADFPVVDPQDGLKTEETGLTLHYIYLNSLEGDEALKALAAGINNAQTALTAWPKNEGLAGLLRGYLARLALLKYKALRQNYAAGDLTSEREKAREDFFSALDSLPAAAAVQLRTQYAKLQETAAPRRDMPSYDVLEQNFAQTLAACEIQGDFWPDKAALDNLLDNALAVRHLFAPEEIIQAVNVLYDLGLEAYYSELSAQNNAILVAKVNEFKKPDGFTFTPAEKGYGYFILLRLLTDNLLLPGEKTVSLPVLRERLAGQNSPEAKILTDVLACIPENTSGITYYPESAALIIEHLRRQGVKDLPEILYSSAGEGLAADYARMGDALGRNDLREAVRIAEEALREALNKWRAGRPEIASIYADPAVLQEYMLWNKSLRNNSGENGLPAEFEGYTAEKMLLALANALIRLREESGLFQRAGLGQAEQKTNALLTVLENLKSSPEYQTNTGRYFALRQGLLAAQQGLFVLSLRQNDPAWNAASLSAAVERAKQLLETAQQEAIFAGEKQLLAAILQACGGSVPAPDAAYVIPEEAEYLYTEMLFRLARAELKIAEIKLRKGQTLGDELQSAEAC